MSDEIAWEETGGEGPRPTSPVLDLPEGFALAMGLPHAAQWVRTPPELGSRKLYIQKVWHVLMNCPINGCNAPGRITVVELEEDISVLCCKECKQYGWVRTSKFRRYEDEGEEGTAEAEVSPTADSDEGGL